MTAALVRADTRSPVPPYEQVRTQLAVLIEVGELPPGARLPTVRQLAADLDLAVNTVARAYRELEAAGLVVTRRRAGTSVTFDLPTGSAPAGPDLQRAAAAFVTAARRSGATEAQIRLAVDRALQAPPRAPRRAAPAR